MRGRKAANLPLSPLVLKALPYLIGVLIVAGWAYHERELGAAKVEASNFAALAAQNLKDAATNQKLAVELQAKVTQLEAIAAAGGAKIDLLPIEPGSPADEAAAAAVRCMLDEKLCVK